MPATLFQTFVCVPHLGVRLSRSACGKRHAKARREGRGERANAAYGHKASKVSGNECARCPVGAAHARAQHPKTWPDGTPIELVRLRIGVATPPERPLPEASPLESSTTNPEREEDRVPKQPRTTKTKPRAPRPSRAPTLKHDGEEKTVWAWAKDPRNTAGITATGLRARLGAGWSLADALTTPAKTRGRRPRPASCGAGPATEVR